MAQPIAEGANGPATFDADRILQQRRVMVLADLVLDAGGVTVSYFEWLRNPNPVRFGRMEARFEETALRNVLREVETLTGRAIGAERLRPSRPAPTGAIS